MRAIKIDPKIMGGQPCFEGTRVPVEYLFELLGKGYNVDYFVYQYPTVSREQAVAVLEAAGRQVLKDGEVVVEVAA